MLRDPPPPTLLANFYFWWFCVTFPSLTDSGKSIARHPLTELITHTFINNIAISRKTDCRQMLLSVYNFVVFIRLVHRNHFSLVKSYDSRKRHPFIYTALSRNLSRQIPQKNTIHLVVYGKLNTIAFGLKKMALQPSLAYIQSTQMILFYSDITQSVFPTLMLPV